MQTRVAVISMILEAGSDVAGVNALLHEFAPYILGRMGIPYRARAAHERVLFEKLKSEAHPVMPQLLLQPVPVQLTKPEAQAVLENLPLLQSLGFDVSEFSDWQLVLRQVPADLSPDDACAALEAFAEDLLTGKRPSESDLRDNLLHTMACKAAIKAGWHTEPKEREALVREVLSRDDIKYCPHGRPVCIELTRKELEKQFKRT